MKTPKKFQGRFEKKFFTACATMDVFGRIFLHPRMHRRGRSRQCRQFEISASPREAAHRKRGAEAGWSAETFLRHCPRTNPGAIRPDACAYPHDVIGDAHAAFTIRRGW
jgi:hypothetical protein